MSFADNEQVKRVERRLEQARNTITKLAAAVGAAKQVRQYDSDRRKSLVAEFAIEHLKAGKSAAVAELEARANPAYKTRLEALAAQYEASEKTIAEWDAAFVSYEAARSLLSMEKEVIRM